MEELKQKMREMFGKGNVQNDLFVSVPEQSRFLPSVLQKPAEPEPTNESPE